MPVQLPGKSFTGTDFTPSLDWLLNQHTAEVKTVEIDVSFTGGETDSIVKSALVLGIVTATGRFKQYNDGAADGTEVAAAVLLHPVYKKDVLGNAIVAPAFAAVVLRGRVDGAKLTGIDAAGRVDLKAQGFLFDDELP